MPVRTANGRWRPSAVCALPTRLIAAQMREVTARPARLDQLNRVPVQDVVLAKGPASLLLWFVSMQVGRALLGIGAMVAAFSLVRHYRAGEQLAAPAQALTLTVLFWAAFGLSIQNGPLKT